LAGVREGPSDCIRITEVAAALKEMKRQSLRLVRASSRNDTSHRGYWNSLDIHSEWQWHLLGHMLIGTSLQTDNHANIPPLSFLQAGCPSCCPSNSVKALKA